MTKENPDGEYVGLYIVSLNHLSLAILMNPYAIYEVAHINSIKLRFPDLLAIEEDFARGCKANPPECRLSSAVRVQKPLSPTENPPKQCNFLLYENSTQMAKGTAPTVQREVDRSFLQLTAKAHNIFRKDPSVSQILIRDNNGATYCRRTFGREIYYQQFHQQRPHYDFIHRIEKTTRATLLEEQNITLL